MLDLKSLSSGTPIPPVAASDVKRVWVAISRELHSGATVGSVSWDVQFVAGQCSENADPAAVFFRAALIWPLLEEGLINQWLDGDRPRDIVYEKITVFPLPEGIHSFRPDEFVEALTAAS